MKRNALALLLAVVLILGLTACGARPVEQTVEQAEETVETVIDTVEDKVENAVETTTTTPPTATLTAEDAERIALEHAALADSEISNLYTEFDMDDGVPEYEVSFHHDGMEYEYTIHAETGDILSRDFEIID